MCTITAGKEQGSSHATSTTCHQGLVPLVPAGSQQASKCCIQEEKFQKLPNHGDQEKEHQFRRAQDLSPGRGRRDGDRGCRLIAQCPGWPMQCGSAGCSAGLWHSLEIILWEKRAVMGPQHWGKLPHRPAGIPRSGVHCCGGNHEQQGKEDSKAN